MAVWYLFLLSDTEGPSFINSTAQRFRVFLTQLLRPHYRALNARTGRSAPVPCFGTLASRCWPLVLLPWHQETGSCSSAQKPVSNSRPLYAGRRPLGHQAPRGLISGEKSAPDFDDT